MQIGFKLVLAMMLGAVVTITAFWYVQGGLSPRELMALLMFWAVLAILALAMLHASVLTPLRRLTRWVRGTRQGRAVAPNFKTGNDEMGELAVEVRGMAENLEKAVADARQEARLRLASEAIWTPTQLREFVRAKLGSTPLFSVSNREPFVHVHQNGDIVCKQPASGLVTALDPVMRACEGMWVAQGSGDADMQVSGKDGKIQVPPDQPSYTLKRVWLSPEEEKGYYYGFSNEGLWPLCHVAHAHPVFRREDWEMYQAVNAKFADALVKEFGKEAPLVLIQDYHFALLPKMIKERRPDAKVAIFWHIPWPNTEAFAICPWYREVLEGMLGADLVGFQIQFHCNNFLDTINYMIESRIDWEHFCVLRGNSKTLVLPFQISVDVPGEVGAEQFGVMQMEGRKKLEEIGVRAQYVGIGVDRLDYTKGLPERLRAIERFLEKYPQYVGKFVFVELSAPSRAQLALYKGITDQVEEMIDRINTRFRTGSYQPIVYLKGQHGPDTVNAFYRIADICIVSSLHDGMNLVAKEYVAAREDLNGTLVLSRFAGASRELSDAIQVNPYDTEEVCEAIRKGLEMPHKDKTERMSRMRKQIQENNVYRWAGKLIEELSRLG